MENRIKYISFFLILILVAFAAKANAQTSEIDTIYYYDRDSDNFLILSCSGSCRPISVGFDLSEGYSYSIEEIRISIMEEGKYAFSIHLGTDFPDDSNIIYQDSVSVHPSERDSIIDDELVFKSILLGDIAELRDLKEKFWFVLNANVTQMNNIRTPPDSFSQHSFFKFNFTDTTWYSFLLEWVVEAIVKKNAVGIDFGSWTYMPNNFNLLQNYPNPFNPETRIDFALPEAGMTRLVIYDLLGREVARLIDGELSAGYHQVMWDASESASGIYFYRLTSGDFVKIKKMVLLK